MNLCSKCGSRLIEYNVGGHAVFCKSTGCQNIPKIRKQGTLQDAYAEHKFIVTEMKLRRKK